MSYAMQPVLRCLSLLLAVTLPCALLAGCAATATLGDVPNCSRLLSASGLMLPTPPVDLPAGDVVSDWQVGFLGQTGQLEKSNDDKSAGFALIGECEAMHREALVNAKKPWWKRLF